MNATGDRQFERALNEQLRRNDLTSEGTPAVMTKEEYYRNHPEEKLSKNGTNNGIRTQDHATL
jgi:hypothetical protein